MTQRDEDLPDGPDAPHTHGAVDCRALARMLGEYVDDELPPDVKQAMDGHMAMCAPCLAFLRQYRFAPDATRRMMLSAAPPELEMRVLTFLRARCAPKSSD